MMASPSQLSLDFKPQIFSMLQNQNPFGDQATEQAQKLEHFLARLEEEKLKIDAFKRELPLCMQLLNNAMEASRQQLQSERASQEARPVLEQFIPLTNTNTNSTNVEMNEGIIAPDKANWMTSAQLWNQEREEAKAPQESDIKLGLNGEAFPELALASRNEEEMEEKRNSPETKRERDGSQTHRKARRCWSPDLHRRFVNALHMLGGSQVATPKQIRELMKVDGLTNDEVKSHLQKYRLHTRRPSPSPQAAATAGPQVVVLGSIWVPPEYAAAAAAAHGGAQLYGAHSAATHHVSPLFCSPTTPVPQDRIFPGIAPPPNQQQLHLYNKPPVTRRNISPESDLRGGGAGDPSESIEDGKSESGSWKADSGGDNGGQRRRVEGEESNASVVSLKF